MLVTFFFFGLFKKVFNEQNGSLVVKFETRCESVCHGSISCENKNWCHLANLDLSLVHAVSVTKHLDILILTGRYSKFGLASMIANSLYYTKCFFIQNLPN